MLSSLLPPKFLTVSVVLFFFLFFVQNGVLGQGKSSFFLECNVSDSISHFQIDKVSILVYNKSNGAMVGAFETDSSGFSKIDISSVSKSDTVFLDFSRAGYKKKRVEVVNQSRDLNTLITLSPIKSELNNVTVKSISPVVFNDNILKYNLSSVQNFEHMTLLDIFGNLPYLWIEDDVVKMMGKPLVILVNNKPHAFYNNSKNLNSLPPQAIEKVEVNIVPTARNGSQKVMNITLKKNYFLGWAGNFIMSGSRLGVGPSASLNYWGNKFGFTLSANFSYSRRKSNGSSSTETIDRLNNSIKIDQTKEGIGESFGGGLFASAFYNIDSLSTIDLQWSGSLNRSNGNSNGNVRLENSGGSVIFQQSIVHSLSRGNNNVLGINYTRKFRKPNKEFYILSQMSLTPSKRNYDVELYSGTGSAFVLDSDEQSEQHNRSKEATVEAVFQNNINPKFRYTIGSKFISRWSKSNMSRGALQNNPFLDTSIYGEFKSLQTVFTAYGDANIRLAKKVTLSTGLRFESVDFTVTQKATKNNQRFNNLIPTISLTYTVNNSNLLSLSYTRNVQRPDFNSFNSFSIIQNAYLRDSGNANLLPQVKNSIGLQYYGNSGSIRYGAGIDYLLANNFIDVFYTTSEDAVISRTTANSKYQSWTFSLNFEMPITKKIRFSHFSSGSLVSQKGQGYSNDLFSGYTQDRLVYNVSKNHRLSVSTTAFSPNLTLQGKDQAMAYWNTKIGYAYYFVLKKNSAQIGITLDNPWLTKGFPAYNEQSGVNFYFYGRTYSANSFINLSFVLNFVGKQYKNNSFNRSRSIQNNDIKQVNL